MGNPYQELATVEFAIGNLPWESTPRKIPLGKCPQNNTLRNLWENSLGISRKREIHLEKYPCENNFEQKITSGKIPDTRL